MDELIKSADIALGTCLRLTKDESFLVVTDAKLKNIGYAFFEAGKKITQNCTYLEILPREMDGNEPEKQIARLMQDFDVVVIPTSKSMTHTKARRDACAKGARIATLPGIREDSMARTLQANYNEIEKRTHKISELLKKTDIVEIKTQRGTDVRMSIKNVNCLSDTGIIHNKGDYGNLPGGESFLSPVYGSTNGKLVIDGVIAKSGFLKEDPIIIDIKDGFATEIQGNKYSKELASMLDKVGKGGRNVAELGIGTNEKAKLIGSILEDEKVMGTVHIAFGNNLSMGGKVDVPLHLDGIILAPTVWLDGKKIMEGGNLLI